MEGESHSKELTIGIAIVVVLVLGTAFFFLRGEKNPEPEIEGSDLNTENIGGEIFSQVEEGGKVAEESIPSTNPFDDAESTNPFDNYQNPFE